MSGWTSSTLRLQSKVNVLLDRIWPLLESVWLSASVLLIKLIEMMLSHVAYMKHDNAMAYMNFVQYNIR